ncbi:MAG: DNA repair protein RecO [Chloroflexi bacterium]|nr:DNA repair protein RecO [Chloroflexota bacterium]
MSRPERAFRTPAIILKRRDFNEADRLLTVLTPAHGKIDVIAKGARKLTSHKTGHVELYTRADLLVHTGRELGIAVQAQMVEPYLRLRQDLQRGAYAGYAVELLDRFSAESDDDGGQLFRLLDDTLARLCSEKDVRLVIRYYEIRLLDLVGFRPELFHCVEAHEELQPEEQYFSYTGGGVVCPRHRATSSSLVTLPLTILKLLRHMQRSPFAQVKALQITTALHDQAERLLLGYITFLLERKLQSVEFIQRIRR